MSTKAAWRSAQVRYRATPGERAHRAARQMQQTGATAAVSHTAAPIVAIGPNPVQGDVMSLAGLCVRLMRLQGPMDRRRDRRRAALTAWRLRYARRDGGVGAVQWPEYQRRWERVQQAERWCVALASWRRALAGQVMDELAG